MRTTAYLKAIMEVYGKTITDLGPTRHKFNNIQVDPKCLLCGNAEETVEHYILVCEKLEKFRNLILSNISAVYFNKTGEDYKKLSTCSKLQIIIDCSILVNRESTLSKKLKLQDLSSLEFHARRLTHVLHTNDTDFLNTWTNQNK